jgi:Methyltransferase domain
VNDAEQIELESDSVDGVLCQSTYMLTADPAAAVAATRRVLRRGGRGALSVWGAPQAQPVRRLPRATEADRSGHEPDRSPKLEPANVRTTGSPSPTCPAPELNCIQPKPAKDDPPCWPGIEPEARVKAIMGMAIGTRPITFGANLENVTVPTVLVAGGRDQNSVQAVSEAAFAAISSADKLFVAIPNATHRSFDSTYCAQLQSAGAKAKSNSKATLDLHTVGLIAASPPGGLSGKAVHYCAPGFLTSPVNIQRVVASISNAEYFCSGTEDPGLGDQLDPSCNLIPPVAGPPSPCVTTSIPCTGLETEEVKQGVKEIAVAFFASALKPTGSDGIHFTRYLAPKWLMKHVPMVGSARALAGPGSVCPPGQGVICSD